jgi:hypothetical protein
LFRESAVKRSIKERLLRPRKMDKGCIFFKTEKLGGLGFIKAMGHLIL